MLGWTATQPHLARGGGIGAGVPHSQLSDFPRAHVKSRVFWDTKYPRQAEAGFRGQEESKFQGILEEGADAEPSRGRALSAVAR